jgi:flagellar basal-body rod modification protein FlgD
MTPTVSSVTSTSPAATSSSNTTSSAATTGFGSNFNTFLKLLTTQLKNQNPTSPLDTNQFTQQLVQFAQVEQSISTNDKLSSLVSMQTSDQAISALPLVGKTIQFNGNSTVLPDGGSAKFSYSLPSTASQSVITITNAQGQVVWRGAGSTDAGSHDFTWNGKNPAGVVQPPGTYTMDVSAQAADKSAVTAKIAAYGKVDGVQIQNNAAVLAIGGMQIPVTKLLSISGAAT